MVKEQEYPCPLLRDIAHIEITFPFELDNLLGPTRINFLPIFDCQDKLMCPVGQKLDRPPQWELCPLRALWEKNPSRPIAAPSTQD
jgi:hypothetical protein